MSTEEGIYKCEGSGGNQMVDWDPSDTPSNEFPQGYPGASVCIYCSYGVLLRRGTVHKATSQAGFEGTGGTLRTHWVEWKFDGRGPGPDPIRMAYRKQDLT